MGTFHAEANGETWPRLTETHTVKDIQIMDSEGFDSQRSENNYIEQGSLYDMDREGYHEIFSENSCLQRTVTKKQYARK